MKITDIDKPRADTGEPPGLREEIERKTHDEMARLLCNREQGVISHAQFRQGAESLWNSVSGLIPRDMMDILSQMRAMPIEDGSEALTQAFGTTTDMVITQRVPGDDGKVKVIRQKDGLWYRSVINPAPGEYQPNKWAKNTIQKVGDALTAKGHRRV